MNILDLEIFDSRDVIARIAELQEDTELTNSEEDELFNLLNLQNECQDSPDWQYGETIIKHSYFLEYIKDLINECYQVPKELDSGEWPWRHFNLDYQAAADEAEQDYYEFYIKGETYLIRT